MIGGFCIGCTIVYGINLLMLGALILKLGFGGYLSGVGRGVGALLGGLVAMFNDAPPRNIETAQRCFLFAIFILIPVNFGLPMLVLHRVMNVPVLVQYREQEVREFEIGDGSLTRGNPGAPIEVVYFSDFKCPHCKRFGEDSKELLNDFEGEVFMVMKHFPLHSKCNPLVATLMNQGLNKIEHEGACEMAALAQSLHAKGKFWDTYLDLYSRPGHMPDSELEEIAKAIGWTLEEWRAASDQPEVQRRVSKDIEEGIQAEVGRKFGLPAIFVNGRYVPSGRTEDIRKVLSAVRR